MTLAGKRAEFAAALNQVGGCQGHPYRPAVPNTGDCWPVMGPADRSMGTAFMQTWGVRVLLPADEVAAADWWDAHWPGIFTVLEPVGFVQRTEPVTIQVSGGEMLAIQITVVAEE